MSFRNTAYAIAWNSLPAGIYHPKEGDRTMNGGILKKNPPLSSPYMVRFAVFDDVRFYIRKHCRKLIPFLPQGFEFIDEPNGQNCFMYALGMPKQKTTLSRIEFETELRKKRICNTFSNGTTTTTR